MKRVALLFACTAGLFAAPAGAASGPADFEMAPSPRAVVASASGGFKSPVLRAPRRFDLVGLRWRRGGAPAISLRVRRTGGHWSKWTAVPTDPADAPDRGTGERSPRGFSAPVWTGDSDYVQFHMSHRVAGLRLHFVSVPRATRRALGSRRSAAQAGQPPIHPRADWGAQDCPPRSDPDFGEVQAALVHHTVSANDYDQSEVPAIVLSICRYHRNSNGWNDIGYNFLVDKYGGIWEGRAGGVDQPVIGAQAQGYNSQTTGIADIGNHQDLPAADAELNAIASLIRWKLPLHGAPTYGEVTLTSGGGSLNRYPSGTPVTVNRVAGHRDGDSTECPGNALYAQLPDLRGRVGQVNPNQARTRIDAVLAPPKVIFPAQATVTGTLRQINGDPVPGAPLEIQAFGTSGWRTVWRATSAADGSFSTPIGAQLSHVVRVQFPGDPGRLPGASKPLHLVVAPAMTLKRSDSRRLVGQTVTLSGTVKPSKGRLVLWVERRNGKERTRGRLALGARGGKFSRAYRFHSIGLFRFWVAFAGDAHSAKAQSPAVYVRSTPAATTGGGVSSDVS